MAGPGGTPPGGEERWFFFQGDTLGAVKNHGKAKVAGANSLKFQEKNREGGRS